ncbi:MULTISPECIES: histidine phosphatase family protein [unclassified Cyanobium]|uniref:SixA phosphatase family protein n=1 Tax=unclassified Cyanobium TaxID=2627006 RepID=UPI0020CC1605|nr:MULTISPECIES: histidine phosphatase family protein [unclassified Cyanobium]MCP9858702.1 histidine phosphatase family protein [Cyanobium sp. Cruz-8H5]MCP9865915.1 histidine phosphatase family protein [Cyanobium sp. Cruz-8D1]
MAPHTWELLLLRHGIAEERSPTRTDAGRELTAAGRARTRAVLERANRLGLRADRLFSSPLARAWQTAEIARMVGLAPAIELAQALEPGGDPLPLLQGWLTQGGASPSCRLLLVGHEPDLGLLASRLLGAPPGAIALRKAGLALLRLPLLEVGSSLAGKAGLEWLMRPRLWLPRP